MSNINPNNIDGTFPIAGQDNSSQGFRDNFTNIRNNFSYAQTEINDLQAKALVANPLTGQSLNNNMAYNALIYPQLTSPSYSEKNLGQLSAGSAVSLDYSQANVFWIETNGNYVMGFNSTTWPAVGQLGDMLLIVQVATQSDTLTFTTTSPGITLGFTDIPGASLNNPSTGSGTLYFDTVGTYMLRFTTIDSGKNIQITDLSRNFATLRDPNLYWNDANPSYPFPTLLVGFGASQTSFTQALAAESGQDTVSVFGSYNSVAVGNLTLANINYPAVDTGQMGGYSVSAARGNLQITNGISTTNSNDFLGYFNSIAYTGTGLSSQPAFQQVSSIGFYATGSSPTYGLGGNIAFFTHVPAATGNVVTQAMGIENDQSTHIFGNIFLSATNNTGTGTSSYVPASSSSTGTTGQVAWNQSYIYICTGPNTWKRTAISTF